MGIIPFGDRPFSGRTPGGGERELTKVELGKRFYVPTRDAQDRLERYDRAERLLDPKEHVALFRESMLEPPGDDTAKHWVPVDFPGMLTRLMRHYTIGRDFRVKAVLRGNIASGEERELKAQAQTEIDRITKGANVPQLLRQVTEALPAFGDAVLRVDVEEKEGPDGDKLPQCVVRYIKPSNYFPELDPLDRTRVLSVTLAWVFPLASGTESGDMVVLREIHEPGSIAYKLNSWDGSKLGDERPVASEFPDLEDRETGIDELPIIHMGYQTRAGEHWGQSELLRVERLMLALENRLSQEDEVLEKHARPKLIVGPGVMDPDGRASLKDFDIIEVNPDILEKAVTPSYLTWDMQVGGITHEIEKLEEYLFITTETSPASFGLERDGSQVESARALRFKAHRTVNKVNDVRDELDGDVQALYRICQKLELAARSAGGTREGFRRMDVALHFGDPILEDQTQEVLDAVLRKQVGLLSRSRGVQDLDDLTDVETDAEVQEILQDMVDESAASAATLGGGFPVGAAIPPEVAPPAGVPDVRTTDTEV